MQLVRICFNTGDKANIARLRISGQNRTLRVLTNLRQTLGDAA
jgi:hypothetical protein